MRHDNYTGRWLTPFRASWHPSRYSTERHVRSRSQSASSIFQGRPVGDRIDGTATPSRELENRRGQVGLGGQAQRGRVGKCCKCACHSSNQVKTMLVMIAMEIMLFSHTLTLEKLACSQCLDLFSLARDALVGGNSSGRLHLFM